MQFGPANGTLTVRTGKGGAASKAGHNLRLEVGEWSATLDVEAGTASLSADPRSLRVVEATGGVMPIGDDEKAAIPQTIDEEVLKGSPIEFRSSSLETTDGRIRAHGELQLFGTSRPIDFDLAIDDEHLTGTARIKHSDFGVKPYSALFGTLKVADEVVIDIDARSPDG